jgi:hypothetical protein
VPTFCFSTQFLVTITYDCIPPLKKVIAITFLILFLFNVGGYYLVFWALRTQAKSNLLHRLNADEYASDDIEVLSIPLNLPYAVAQGGDYQETDGEFEHNGSYFHVVKQRIENDTLYLVCVKNHQVKKLMSKLNEYSNLMNNVPSGTKQALNFFGKLFKDYTSSDVTSPVRNEGWIFSSSFVELTFTVLTKDYPILSPPPKTL